MTSKQTDFSIPALFVKYRQVLIVVTGLIVLMVFNQWREMVTIQTAGKLHELSNVRSKITAFEQDNQRYQKLIRVFAPPSARSEIDAFQNEIIRQIKAAGLDIQGIETMPETAQPGQKATGAVFEVTVIGEWLETMEFLNSLPSGTCLVNLRSVRMEADPGSRFVKTRFGYKIYTED